MGREVMRVPMDFDCPIGETWSGRLNPHRPEQCSTCRGYGRDESYKALEALVQLVMLAGSDSKQRGGIQHPYFRSTPLAGLAAPKLHELTSGLAGRECRDFFIGHDALDSWQATQKLLTAAGLAEEWGTCPTCGGSGYAPGQEELVKLSEEWEMPDPPKGDGWQIWQTVSEGGPVSPVFSTPEALARWMATPGNDTSITRGRTYEQWLAFITGPGWAPSMVMRGGELMDGVDAATRS
jgi:hypothetical protein